MYLEIEPVLRNDSPGLWGRNVNERRRGRRVLIRRTVQFSWEGGEASGWGRDISAEGMYVVSDRRPAPGAGVRITVRFHRVPAISIPGRVCRATSDGFAVVFEALGCDEIETLKRVVGTA